MRPQSYFSKVVAFAVQIGKESRNTLTDAREDGAGLCRKLERALICLEHDDALADWPWEMSPHRCG